MIILGIESTCDETSIGVVENGRKTLSSQTASSLSMHRKYGGVVPEVAAREQLRVIIPLLSAVQDDLEETNLKLRDIDEIAVAYGPGLVGSLLIGVETAKTLALSFNKPLIGVNHLIGHMYANWLAPKSKVKGQRSKAPTFPLVALIVSGGHTDLILMTNHDKVRWLGGTLDDAAGEVFDKVARELGLGYPGGPEIERVARSHKSKVASVKFPRPKLNDQDFDFSFSGLKTAVVNIVGSSGFIVRRSAELSYEFQEAIVDVLVAKTIKAARKFGVKSIVVGGGVAANSELRRRMMVDGEKNNIEVHFPTKDLSVDNGAMIAAAAFYQKNFVDSLKLQADPCLHF